MDVFFFIKTIISGASNFLRMIMLINNIGTLPQTRMGLGRVTVYSKRHTCMRGQYVSLMAKHSHLFWPCFIAIIISTDSASYCLKMIMLISLVDTLTQARMGVGRVTFPSKWPMRGHYVFLTAKYVLFIDFFYFIYYLRTQSLISLTLLCVLVWEVPWLKLAYMGIGRVTFSG